MTDWVPVLIVALVVVCVTAYLLLDPKPVHQEKAARAGPFHQPTTSSHWISGYSGVLPPSPAALRSAGSRPSRPAGP